MTQNKTASILLEETSPCLAPNNITTTSRTFCKTQQNNINILSVITTNTTNLTKKGCFSVDNNVYWIGVQRRDSDQQWLYIDGTYLQFSEWYFSSPVISSGGYATVERQSDTVVEWRQRFDYSRRSICQYPKRKNPQNWLLFVSGRS